MHYSARKCRTGPNGPCTIEDTVRCGPHDGLGWLRRRVHFIAVRLLLHVPGFTSTVYEHLEMTVVLI